MKRTTERAIAEPREARGAGEAMRADALAGMLRVAGALVHDEPDAASLADLRESGVLDGLPEGFDDPCLARGLEFVRGDLESHIGGGGHVAALQREWLRLFAGVGEPLVPSWSNYYLDPEHKVLGRETLEVRGLYARHGLRLEREGAEQDDELGLMLRFLAHLVGVGAAADARELLALHVLPWISRWRYLGDKHAESAFYRGAVEFVFGAVRTCAFDLGFDYKESTRSFMVRKDTK